MSFPATGCSAGASGGMAEGLLPPGFIPAGMACRLDLLTALDEPLHAAETPGTERMAPVRLREFVAGRTAARRAIGQLTGLALPVPRHVNRSPVWPAGLCGSLSHSRRYAICVVGKLAQYQAVGVDIEEDSRLEKNLWGSVMTGAELAFLEGWPMPRAEQTATLLFSAKEAYFKCLPRSLFEPDRLPGQDRIETSVDFGSTTLTCSVPQDQGLPVATGCFTQFDGHWITLFCIPT